MYNSCDERFEGLMKRLVLGSKVLGSILLGSAVLAMIACGGSTTPEKDATIDIDAKADVDTDVPKDAGADTPLIDMRTSRYS